MTKAAKPTPAAHSSASLIQKYPQIALVLQGGGALGSYQAGVFDGLAQAGIEPTWITGISIGALNTAIIAGNLPENRTAALKGFWDTICTPNVTPGFNQPISMWINMMDQWSRKFIGTFEANRTMLEGQKGFFKPRFPLPIMGSSKPANEVSFYTTDMLRDTLLRFADFDLINKGKMRVSVGAVNVATGNLVYFDNQNTTLRPEHFMASGALPPGFPAIEIDGQFYWDGGVVSNTPLSEIINDLGGKDTLVFQVDVWSARGSLPENFADVTERLKDIQYSSRTRLVTDTMKSRQDTRRLLKKLLDKIPSEKHDAICTEALKLVDDAKVNIVHLIYDDKDHQTYFKDYEFSQATMLDHWQSGLDDIKHSLTQDAWFKLPSDERGFITNDIHRSK